MTVLVEIMSLITVKRSKCLANEVEAEPLLCKQGGGGIQWETQETFIEIIERKK